MTGVPSGPPGSLKRAAPPVLDRGRQIRYAAITMKRSLATLPGKHRKCRVPLCHLPTGAHPPIADTGQGSGHCFGNGASLHICGRPNPPNARINYDADHIRVALVDHALSHYQRRCTTDYCQICGPGVTAKERSAID